MRVIVCGSRHATRYGDVAVKLDEIHAREPISLVIHGAQRGVDAFAEDWAKSREIPYLGIPAEWSRYKQGRGNPAGPKRNRAMLRAFGIIPEKVIAFPGGVGTADMKEAARDAGVFVQEVS